MRLTEPEANLRLWFCEHILCAEEADSRPRDRPARSAPVPDRRGAHGDRGGQQSGSTGDHQRRSYPGTGGAHHPPTAASAPFNGPQRAPQCRCAPDFPRTAPCPPKPPETFAPRWRVYNSPGLPGGILPSQPAASGKAEEAEGLGLLGTRKRSPRRAARACSPSTRNSTPGPRRNFWPSATNVLCPKN